MYKRNKSIAIFSTTNKYRFFVVRNVLLLGRTVQVSLRKPYQFPQLLYFFGFKTQSADRTICSFHIFQSNHCKTIYMDPNFEKDVEVSKRFTLFKIRIYASSGIVLFKYRPKDIYLLTDTIVIACSCLP